MRSTTQLKSIFSAAFVAAAIAFATQAKADLLFDVLATYESGHWDKGAAQSIAYDKTSKLVLVANTKAVEVDILDISDPSKPIKIADLNFKQYGSSVNSVAVHNGLAAAAISARDPQDSGQVVFFDATGRIYATVTVGAMPDMVTFTYDGNYVLTANEGEPNYNYSIDPPGTVSIIDISEGFEKIDKKVVKTVGFEAYDDIKPPKSKKKLETWKSPLAGAIVKPGVKPSLDFEPEYIAVSPDNLTAFVTLQEANAVAVINIAEASLTKIIGLGFTDYSKHGLDPSDRDNMVAIRPYKNVFGIYQPDGIAAYSVEGMTYFVTANEGESRKYSGYTDEVRVGEIKLDPTAFPNAATLQTDQKLGRLIVHKNLGDIDGDGDYDQLYTFGARSMAIWDAEGNQVSETGYMFENKTAFHLPKGYNADNDSGTKDVRSDERGPEPENVVLGMVEGHIYSFTALERVSAVLVNRITAPSRPYYNGRAHNRNFDLNPEKVKNPREYRDLGPEGLAFVKATESPIGLPLLIVGNEVSGTTTIYKITVEVDE